MTDEQKREKLLNDPQLKPVFDQWRQSGKSPESLSTSYLESLSPVSQSEYLRRLRFDG
jgi:hypothetical protein